MTRHASELTTIEHTRIIRAKELHAYFGRPAHELTTAEIGFWLWMQSAPETTDEKRT